MRQTVLRAGYVRVEELSHSFGVSLMTMHRDLDLLEEDGWITKIRGAATANPSALLDAGVRERSVAMSAEKAAMVDLAERGLHHGQTVFIDDSTTVLGLAARCAHHTPITLATNFVAAMAQLSPSSGVDVHLLGGAYDARQESCSGLQTVAAIEQMQADLVFMSTTGLLDGRCVHRTEGTIMVRKAFMRRSIRKVLLVDHAKFGRPAPHILCGVEDFDLVITDDGIAPEDLKMLRDRCAEVQVASPGAAAH